MDALTVLWCKKIRSMENSFNNILEIALTMPHAYTSLCSEEAGHASSLVMNNQIQKFGNCPHAYTSLALCSEEAGHASSLVMNNQIYPHEYA